MKKEKNLIKQVNKLFQPSLHAASAATEDWTYKSDYMPLTEAIDAAIGDVMKGKDIIEVTTEIGERMNFNKIDFLHDFGSFQSGIEFLLDNSESDNFFIGYQFKQPVVKECIKGNGYNCGQGIEVNRKQLNSLYLYGMAMFYSDDVFNSVGSVIDKIKNDGHEWGLEVGGKEITNETAVTLFNIYCIETDHA